MKLNPISGNMYKFITHTWNPIKGKCLHDCAYCYMKTMPYPLGQMRLDMEELKGEFNPEHFIFIGSSTDFCADSVPSEWIKKVFDFCYTKTNGGLFDEEFDDNRTRFLIQTKNPKRLLQFKDHPLFNPKRNQVVICTTLETNRFIPEIMKNSPTPLERAENMALLAKNGLKTYVTLEPIMDFDKEEFLELIRICKPEQVNIGRNTNKSVFLPPPSEEKLIDLIKEIQAFTNVFLKDNIDNRSEVIEKSGFSFGTIR